MKKFLSLVLVLAVMVGAIATLTSCGAPDDPGAEISVYLGDGVYDLDPSDYYANDNAAQLMSLIYEPLFTLNEKGKLVKAAAEKYKVDEKERTITIELRESYWSDGARVKADDFVYAWRNAILDPTKANSAAPLFYDIENAIEIKNGDLSIYKLGAVANNYELTITYREGADYEQLLRNLASVAASPVREDVVNLAPSHWSKNSNTIANNGPFKVKSLDFDLGELTLERNLGYHQPSTVKDYDNKVTPYRLVSVFSVGDEKVELSYSDIENKTVFYLGDASLEDRKANKDKAITADLASTYTYVFNTENPLFAIKEVRQALSIAIDRATIINEITFGKAASGLLPSVSSSGIYNKKNPQALINAAADMQKAEQLIASANLAGLDKTFTLTVNNDEESIKIAELVKASWEKLGFTVRIKKVGTTSSNIMDKATDTQITIYDSTIQYLINGALDGGEANYDVIAIDLQTYSNDAFVSLAGFSSTMNGSGVFLSDNTHKGNIARWSNAEYDALITAAYNETDATVRAEILRAAEYILVNEAPIVPIVFNVNFAFVSDELSDVEVSGFGNFVFTEAELDDYHNYLPKKEEESGNEGSETEE